MAPTCLRSVLHRAPHPASVPLLAMTSTSLDQPAVALAPADPVRASVASWLGALFVLLLLVIVVGGYVRLSGSGLSIPDWPLIRVGDSWTLLPPTNEEDWAAARTRYDVDQAALARAARSGAVGMGSFGAFAHDMPTFKRLFLVEWGHRLAAALVGLVAAACLAVVLRHRDLRGRVGRLFGIACGLIVIQALIGGALVKTGTSTHWLFIHLGTAAIILALIVWTILALLGERVPVAATVASGRRPLRRMLHVAVTLTWIQILLGALVAGSRTNGHDHQDSGQFVSTWPLMMGKLVPNFLWDAGRSLGWNLLDNALLHQWVHRWFAWLVVGALLGAFWAARGAPLAPRLGLSLKAAATILGVQIVLGLANVFLSHPVLVSLAHLVMAMFLLVALVMALFDVRYEQPEALALPAQVGA